MALRMICAAMLTSGDLLVGLHEGSPENAKPPFPRLVDWRGARRLIQNFSEGLFLTLLRNLEKTGLTNQPNRQYLVITLSMQIESFIVFHELGHHRAAHIQYLKRYGGGATISPLLFQMFELEADRHAISTMFNSFYAPVEQLNSPNISPQMRALHSMTSESRWRLWTTMVGLLFLTLEISNPRTCLPDERKFPPWRFKSAVSHPPPLYRLKHAVIWAGELVQPQGDEAFATYRRAVNKSLGDISRMAVLLGIITSLRYFKKQTASYETQLAAVRQNVESEMNALMAEFNRKEYENS
jgi:hypothetical protein